jgi:hypothetical protein
VHIVPIVAPNRLYNGLLGCCRVCDEILLSRCKLGRCEHLPTSINIARPSRYLGKGVLGAGELRDAPAIIKGHEREAITRIPSEIFPKAVDGRASSSGLSFSVDEHDAVDQVF